MSRVGRGLCRAGALAAFGGWLPWMPVAHAEPAASWLEQAPIAAEDVKAGHPLVVVVVVPLCANSQIACGSHGLGSPGNLRTNLYWGALFGARRFFERPERGYERVALDAASPSAAAPWLERVVYRRWVTPQLWGLGGASRVEQIVVLEGFHGEQIDAAVDRFWELAVRGGSVTFQDGDRWRRERVHVAGYAGHDRLMDGRRLPPPPRAEEARPIPSFVLACLSERFFGPALRHAGSSTLVMTSAYVAPEGYAIEAAVRGLGMAASPSAMRDEVVTAYAKWQAIPWRQASRYFAP